MVSVLDLVRTRLFGGHYVRVLPFASQGLLVCWEGAWLGRARGDRLPIFASMIAGSYSSGSAFEMLGLSRALAESEDQVVAYLSKVAPDGLRHYGKTPESLIDLLLVSFSPPEFDFRQISQMRGIARKKMPLADAVVQGSWWFLVGLSLGLTEPDLASALCANPYGRRDERWWSEYRKAGGIGPPRPEDLTAVGMDDAAKILAVGITSTYVDQHHPEVEAALGFEP